MTQNNVQMIPILGGKHKSIMELLTVVLVKLLKRASVQIAEHMLVTELANTLLSA